MKKFTLFLAALMVSMVSFADAVTMKGIVKRALQLGESVVILTHEADGTPHIYNIAGETITEVSQEGVVARDPDNKGDYLSISDIAVTDDGKLVACNYIMCQGNGYIDAGYKQGESRFYIWKDLVANPSIWFTSKMTSNWFRSKQGYTMAVKGTSTNAEILTTGFHGQNGKARFSLYMVANGIFKEPDVNTNGYYHFHNGPSNIGNVDATSVLGSKYELNVTAGNGKWIMDGELVDPYELLVPASNNVAITNGSTLVADLGKAFNGNSYVTYEMKNLAVAPYADAEGKLAGVKVIDITSDLATAQVIKEVKLTAPVAATAAATAVAVEENGLTITLVADAEVHTLTVDLNLKPTTYTVTATANIAERGYIEGLTNEGVYEAGTKVTLRAVAKEGYEFVKWNIDNKIVGLEEEYTFTVTADVEIVAHFKKSGVVEIIGIVKRALQLDESIVILTHEADGTPHIYSIAGNAITEVSQEGVVARDPENKGDYLSISDIAHTDDGKLVACNYIRCQYYDSHVEPGTKRGTSRYYIWNDINATPAIWFTSQQSGGCNVADVGQSFTVKGISTNAKVMTSAAHNNNRAIRINLHTIVDGAEDVNAFYRFGDYLASVYYTEAKQGAKFQLSTTTLNGIWAMDGELANPSAFSIPTTGVLGENYSGTELPSEVELGKKYNGASYVKYNEEALMVAPYADAEGKLAGVKVIDITAGFDAASEVKVANLAAAVEAATAATAVKVVENGLTVTLVGDATLYTLNVELTQDPGPGTAVDNTVVAPQVEKIVRNGQVLIIRDGKTFNMMGQEVK